MSQNDPYTQTNEEWLAEYDSASNQPARTKPPVDQFTTSTIGKSLFRYIDHRTTSMGSVVLEFESIQHNFSAVRFFNVNLRSPHGKNYPAGMHGQFIPPKRGEFRRFWIHAVGKPPSRWCRVHKSMRSALGNLVFTGETEPAVDRKGRQYRRLKNLRLYESSRNGHTSGAK